MKKSLFLLLAASVLATGQTRFSNDSHTLALWRFDEGTGSILNDHSGRGHDGTIHNATWVTREENNGLFFDGENSFVSVPDHQDFVLDGDWTLEAIVGYEVDNSVNARLFSRTTAGEEDYSLIAREPGNQGGYGQLEVHGKLQDDSQQSIIARTYFTDKLHKVVFMKKDHQIYLFHDEFLLYRMPFNMVSNPNPGKITIGAILDETDTPMIDESFFKGTMFEIRLSGIARYSVPQPSAPVCLGYWDGEGEDESLLPDNSGNDNHGYIHGAQRVEGIFGTALRFDGEDDFIEIKRKGSLFIDSAFTVSMWIRNDLQETYTEGTLFSTNRYLEGIWFSVHPTYSQPNLNYILSAYVGSDSSAAYRKHSLNCITADNWNHVALAFDGTASKMYLNGELIDSLHAPGLTGYGDTSLYLGRVGLANFYGNYKKFFRGDLDEIRYYNYALTSDSLKDIYNADIQRASPDLSGPSMSLKGKKTDTLYLGRSYPDYGAHATDGVDGIIDSCIEITTNLDSLTVGTYWRRYTATNSAGYSSTIERVVHVVADTVKPILTLKGDPVHEIIINSEYIDPGFTATDGPGTINITPRVQIQSDVNMAEPGEYRITYTVEDYAGNATSTERTVIVSPHLINPLIRYNQLGYYPSRPKTATIVSCRVDSFYVRSLPDSSICFRGPLSDSSHYNPSYEHIRMADFSSLKEQGQYYIDIPKFGSTEPFLITFDLYREALKALVKSFYYQRSSTELLPAHAGIYAREKGHPDTACVMHPSTGETGTRDVSGGWYDAGDYGKYVVNAGITLWALLSLHELAPELLADGTLNIPESGNNKSDLLDEIKYELDWFVKMQADDGGVFFKVGPLDEFPGFVMPQDDVAQRYVIGKSTTSTLNFAAVMAMAGRIFTEYDESFASNCLERAKSAWEWAQLNSDIPFPNVGGGTGLYDDLGYGDEFLWAATELYISTGEQVYQDYVNTNLDYDWWVPSWGKVGNLSYYSLITNGDKLLPSWDSNFRRMSYFTEQEASTSARTDPYSINDGLYYWGCTANHMNMAKSLLYGSLYFKEPAYVDDMIKACDFLFGRNALGRSFVTGLGLKPPLHPHHRISEADNIETPVPGLVVGGPNARQEDTRDEKYSVVYDSDRAPKSYVDHLHSYASNEPAINYNSATILILGFLEHIHRDSIPVSGNPTAKYSRANIKSSLRMHGLRMHINLKDKAEKTITLTITNLKGQLVHKETIECKAGKASINLLRKHLPTGVYVARVKTSDTILQKRVSLFK